MVANDAVVCVRFARPTTVVDPEAIKAACAQAAAAKEAQGAKGSGGEGGGKKKRSSGGGASGRSSKGKGKRRAPVEPEVPEMPFIMPLPLSMGPPTKFLRSRINLHAAVVMTEPPSHPLNNLCRTHLTL